MTTETILTGIKPTGRPHLGNYLGMIKPAIELMQQNKGHDNMLFIANYHALNSVQDRQGLRESTYDVAATLLACGLNPDDVMMYRQSDIPEIMELVTIITSVTPKGLMDRSHAYKAAVADNLARNADADADINMGLYTYPILMAADILTFDTTIVPVGKDQVQHVEFARDIAGYFNNTFGKGLVLPAHKVRESVATVPGLDGRKMSKSYNNVVPIFDTPANIEAAVKRIVTDSLRPEEKKDPETNNIYLIYKSIADPADAAQMAERFRAGGLGYGDAKKMLLQRLLDEFQPKFERYQHFMNNKAEVDALLAAGAVKARAKAQKVLKRVKDIIGA
ncbi:MAG: tryptophan--tRNA ligase [Bdellovibrionales bacterium]